jgi:hypothetical protein
LPPQHNEHILLLFGFSTLLLLLLLPEHIRFFWSKEEVDSIFFASFFAITFNRMHSVDNGNHLYDNATNDINRTQAYQDLRIAVGGERGREEEEEVKGWRARVRQRLDHQYGFSDQFLFFSLSDLRTMQKKIQENWKGAFSSSSSSSPSSSSPFSFSSHPSFLFPSKATHTIFLFLFLFLSVLVPVPLLLPFT